MSADHKRIAIVGGGASGTITAIHLLRRLSPAWSVFLVEPRSKLGEGIAYSTRLGSHLLNVRAAGMSIFPDDPSHFVRWLSAKRGAAEEELRPVFAERREFAEYLRATLDIAQGESFATFQHLEDSAIALDRKGDRFEVTLALGERFSSDVVVLALGNQVPKSPPVLREVEDEHLVRDPWQGNRLKDIGVQDEVLIIGAGLTMIDTVLALREQGHLGSITAISRHGLLPQPHTSFAPEEPVDPTAPSLRELFKVLVAAGRQRVESGSDWRAVVDRIRPFTQKAWKSLGPTDKRRFTKHLQTFWDVHRHRVAPQVWEDLTQLRAEGKLAVIAGRILSVMPASDRFNVRYQNKVGISQRLHPSWIVNCTGPNPDWREVRNPLVESIVDAGLGEYDPLGWGLAIDDEHRVSHGLYAVGPLCRGTLWETTAVPEIRAQAAKVAAEIAPS